MRPQIVLFGSSIIQMSFDNGGWGAILANLYARKVIFFLLYIILWFFLNSHSCYYIYSFIFSKYIFVYYLSVLGLKVHFTYSETYPPRYNPMVWF